MQSIRGPHNYDSPDLLTLCRTVAVDGAFSAGWLGFLKDTCRDVPVRTLGAPGRTGMAVPLPFHACHDRRSSIIAVKVRASRLQPCTFTRHPYLDLS